MKVCPTCRIEFMSKRKSPHCSRLCAWNQWRTPEATQKRFWQKVVKSEAGGCWLWMGCKCSKGYGSFKSGDKAVGAHRFMWETTFGAIPAGMHVLHKCNNGHLGCVTPHHLYLGTNKENTADKMRIGRHVHGENHPNAKLTEEMVRQIRAEAKIGRRGHREGNVAELARRYGITKVALRNICQGQRWRHVK